MERVQGERAAMKTTTRVYLLVAIMLQAISAPAQESGGPRVHIDCGSCDMEYLRREIDYVNHVRERLHAQIEVLATSEPSSNGGRRHTVTFSGREMFSSLADTLVFDLREDESEDESRDRMRRTIELGLVRYVARAGLAENYSLSYVHPKKPDIEPVQDPWHSWVFRTGAGSWFSGEKSYRSTNVWGSFSANRITEQWKFESSLRGNYDESRYDYGDDLLIENEIRSYFGYQRLVGSLGAHWSVGVTARQRSATYENMDFSATFTPALEYNYYPYSESSRRSLVLRYRIGGGYYDYEEETIYDKTDETLLLHGLEAELDLIKSWGSVGASIRGHHYLKDVDLNQVILGGSVSLNLVKGLSLSLYARYAVIHDQLSLPKGSASEEQVLLRRRQLATSYNYSTSFSLSYSFGSLYTNIVNPRF